MRFEVKADGLEACIKRWQKVDAETRRLIRARSFFVGPAETRRLKQRRNARKIKRRAYVKATKRAA
jgi:hypothetical protein